MVLWQRLIFFIGDIVLICIIMCSYASTMAESGHGYWAILCMHVCDAQISAVLNFSIRKGNLCHSDDCQTWSKMNYTKWEMLHEFQKYVLCVSIVIVQHFDGTSRVWVQCLMGVKTTNKNMRIKTVSIQSMLCNFQQCLHVTLLHLWTKQMYCNHIIKIIDSYFKSWCMNTVKSNKGFTT